MFLDACQHAAKVADALGEDVSHVTLLSESGAATWAVDAEDYAAGSVPDSPSPTTPWFDGVAFLEELGNALYLLLHVSNVLVAFVVIFMRCRVACSTDVCDQSKS